MSGTLLAGLLVAAAVLLWPSPSAASAGRATVLPPRAAPRDVGADMGRALTVEQVSTAMVLLALALRSGAGVLECLETVARTGPAPVRRDLLSVSAALRWGVEEPAAWASVPAAWGRAGHALRLARRTGLAPATLLLAGARDLRGEEAQRLDVAAARLGVRLVLPLGLAFLPAFCLTTVIPVVVALAGQVLTP